MSATRATLRGRRLAQRLMQDTCRVTRTNRSAVRTLDPDTLEYSQVTPTVVYEGKCRVKANARFDLLVVTGDQAESRYRFTVSVPVDDLIFQVDDVVTILTSALDPALPGLELRVREPEFGSQISARRLGCEVNAE